MAKLPASSDILAEYRRLTGVLDQLNEYYGYLLKNDSQALDYCVTRRHLEPETLEYFGIGLAPSVSKILEFLDLNGLSRDDAFSASAVSDMFENRIMFPIHDLAGHVVGFSGRTWRLTASSAPKYVNSPKSSIFWKSLHLYGLHRALPWIRQFGYVVVVEGNIDVASLAQADLPNVVAPCGTALTESQLELLSRFTDCLVFQFDNDQAGRNAALKAQELCMKLKLRYRALKLDGAKDPDEYVQRFGIEPVFRALDEALELS